MTPCETRWPFYTSALKLPAKFGAIDNIDKFDATFFGLTAKQSNASDPQSRLMIEAAYEAIIDAGVCPESIRGSRVGVYVGVSSSDWDGGQSHEEQSEEDNEMIR